MIPTMLDTLRAAIGPDGPSVSTVAVAFAAVVLLALVKITVENRDAVRSIQQSLSGVPGEVTPTGLAARLKAVADQLSAHCTDERQFWDIVKHQRADVRHEVANAATAVVAASELRLTERVDAVHHRIDTIERKVDVLAERRQAPRESA